MNKLQRVASVALLTAVPLRSFADQGGELSVRAVVSAARRHNPQLQAALAEYESSDWDVRGNEGANDSVLLFDGSVSQVATPNVLAGSVRVSEMRRVDAAMQWSKRFWVGTLISLRLSAGIYENELSGAPPVLVANGAQGMETGGTTLPPGFPGFGLGSFGPVYAPAIKLTLKQPLWRGRGRAVGEANLRAARIRRSAGAHARDRVGSSILRDAMKAYWELWYTDAALSIQMQSKELASRQREEARARVKMGSLAGTDLLSFDTQVAARDEDIVNARVERLRRWHELERTMGGDTSRAADVSLADSPPAHADVRMFVRGELEQQVEDDSADLQELADALALARLRERTADDPAKPRLDLDAYAQAQGLGNESYKAAGRQLVEGEVLSGFVGLTYEAPLGSRVRRAEAAKARLATEVALQELREARQRVRAEIRTAVDREAAGREKIELAEQTMAIAEKQLAAEQARYWNGASTPIVLLGSEDNLRSAKLRHARARVDWAQAVLDVEYFTGDLLRRYGGL